MRSISYKLVARCILLLLLAMAAVAAAETPALAKTIKFVTANGLQAACDKVGGYYSASDSGHSYFCVNGGTAVLCSDYKKHICAVLARGEPPKSVLGFPVEPDTAAMVTIPCDPVFCKIYCGGKPYCTFGTQTTQVLRPEDTAPAPSLVTPVPGGGVAPSSPVIE